MPPSSGSRKSVEGWLSLHGCEGGVRSRDPLDPLVRGGELLSRIKMIKMKTDINKNVVKNLKYICKNTNNLIINDGLSSLIYITTM